MMTITQDSFAGHIQIQDKVNPLIWKKFCQVYQFTIAQTFVNNLHFYLIVQ